MKKYIEYMDEITDEMLFDGLLGYGLFSEKLPPIFSSEKFMIYCKKHNNLAFNTDPHEWINVDIIRNTNVPRVLGIPNPFAYYHLCVFLQEHWDKIKIHFREKLKECEFIVSHIHLKKMKMSKKLFEMNYHNWHLDGNPEEDFMIGARYIVKADISSCFSSIYTHAIVWAILGKSEAKQKKKEPAAWFNTLDKLVRYIKNNETHGLLIGPHVSNLISEIILTTVDECLKEWKYVRYIDDYKCYVTSYEEGERFIASLSKELGCYGLSLNYKKTKIEKLPEGEIEIWVNKMKRAKLSWLTANSYTINDDDDEKTVIGYDEVKQYLTYAIENGLDDAAVINYAVKVIRNKFILTENAGNYFYKKMLYLAEIYPYLLRLMDKYVFDLQQENVGKKNLSIHAFKDAMRTNKFEEAYYALLFAIKYDYEIDLSKEEENWIIACNDCILLLISWLYAKKYDLLDLKNSLREKAKDIQNAEFDSYWLFIYECLSDSDFTDKYAGNWKKIKRAKISFIKEEWRY